MHSLIQSKRVIGHAGRPLPPVFRALEDRGTQLIRGQLGLVVAGPGTGKSGLTLTFALRSGVPAFIFSADSDAFMQLTRSLSILTGEPLHHTADAVRSDRTEDYHSVLENLPIRMSYNANPSLSELELELEAYREQYGEYPELIIVDNITNVRTDSEIDDDPFAGLEGLMDYLHGLARTTEACVLGLHHTTGMYNDANKPVPLSGIKGQVARVPELVLTLHKQDGGGVRPDRLCVSTVKNSSGRDDPTGNDYVELEFEAERMRIVDLDLAPLRNRPDQDPFAGVDSWP